MKRINSLLESFGVWFMALCVLVYVTGCLSTAQRDEVLLDLSTAKASITLVYPPGAQRDKWLAELDKVTTVEQLIQTRAKAVAAATQPTK